MQPKLDNTVIKHYLQSGANFHLHVVSVVKFDKPHDEDVTEEDQKTADGRQDRCPRPAAEQTKTEGHLGEEKCFIQLNLANPSYKYVEKIFLKYPIKKEINVV